MINSKTLGEALPIEIARVREIIAEYDSLPNNAGFIGASFMKRDIERAEKAMREGDVVEMINAYKSLQDYTY